MNLLMATPAPDADGSATAPTMTTGAVTMGASLERLRRVRALACSATSALPVMRSTSSQGGFGRVGRGACVREQREGRWPSRASLVVCHEALPQARCATTGHHRVSKRQVDGLLHGAIAGNMVRTTRRPVRSNRTTKPPSDTSNGPSLIAPPG